MLFDDNHRLVGLRRFKDGGARLRTLVLAALMLCISGSALAALFSVDGKNLATELKIAEREGRRLAVYFELPNCLGCRAMKQQVFSEPVAERTFSRYYHTVRIDLASTKHLVGVDGQRVRPEAFALSLHIAGTPAFAFFSPSGALDYRHVGALPDPSDFISLGRFVYEAAYEKLPFSDYRIMNSNLAPKHPLRRSPAT
jgi:thioredoxin-related protein